MAEPNTVIIDVAWAEALLVTSVTSWASHLQVRNHYEAEIGHFQPPKGGAEFIDPKARGAAECCAAALLVADFHLNSCTGSKQPRVAQMAWHG